MRWIWSRRHRDVILANGSVVVTPLLQATRIVPIVFVVVPDPVGAGFVDSLARPGGNATGFVQFEYGLSGKWLELLKELGPAGNATGFTVMEPTIAGKWLELLKEIAPRVNRAAFLFNPATTPYRDIYMNPLKAAAASLRLEAIAAPVHDTSELETVFAAQARGPNGGLIVTGSALAQLHRNLIITLAARHKLPAVYFERFFVTVGGLISYGPDLVDQYRRAAGYVDRILRGEKSADLPVQAPTKYETVVNLKTAKALGLDVPPTLLARADEVIE